MFEAAVDRSEYDNSKPYKLKLKDEANSEDSDETEEEFNWYKPE